MNTEEKLEQSCMVKERGTQYFKVSDNTQEIITFLSPCYELMIMIYSFGHFRVVFVVFSMSFYGENFGGKRCLKRGKKKKKKKKVVLELQCSNRFFSNPLQ